MPKRQNYNPLRVLGLQNDLDDMEIVKQYNLDPTLAYTPEINDAAIKAQYDQNVAAAKKEGMDQESAEIYANGYRKQAQAMVDEAMSTLKKS